MKSKYHFEDCLNRELVMKLDFVMIVIMPKKIHRLSELYVAVDDVDAVYYTKNK